MSLTKYICKSMDNISVEIEEDGYGPVVLVEHICTECGNTTFCDNCPGSLKPIKDSNGNYSVTADQIKILLNSGHESTLNINGHILFFCDYVCLTNYQRKCTEYTLKNLLKDIKNPRKAVMP